MLAGLRNILEQLAPHRQDCMDGPLLGLQDGTARNHDLHSAPRAAASHNQMDAEVGALRSARRSRYLDDARKQAASPQFIGVGRRVESSKQELNVKSIFDILGRRVILEFQLQLEKKSRA